MFMLPEAIKIFVCHSPTDMRKSFDGLSILVQGIIEKDPLSGQMFVFFNRRRDRVKVLWWRQGGFNLFYRRLEKGRFGEKSMFNLPEKSRAISSIELSMILEGIDVKKTRKRARWPPKKQKKRSIYIDINSLI